MSDSEEYEYEYDESDQVSRTSAIQNSFWMLFGLACTELFIIRKEQMDADSGEEESFQYTGG